MSQTGETAPLEVALGALSFRQGDLKTAEADFKTRRDARSQIQRRLFPRWGVYMSRQKDMKQADLAFRPRRTWLRPDRVKRCNYAQFKSRRETPPRGKTVVGRHCQKDAGLSAGMDCVAQLAAAEKKYADGVTLLANVLSRDPQNLEGMLLKGRLELQQGQTAQAINDFEGGGQGVPQSAGCLLPTGPGPCCKTMKPTRPLTI